MKAESNQQVNSGKWILLLALTILVGLLLFFPNGKDNKEAQLIRARQNAEVLGLQMIHKFNYQVSSRSPASADQEPFVGSGEIGMDPWGNPYQFNILKTNKGVARVVLFSKGPQVDPSLAEGEESNSQSEINSKRELLKVLVTPSE